MSNLPYYDPAFLRCILEAAKIPELVFEFDRLQGSNLSRKGSALDLMVDDATGRIDDDLAAFVDFVHKAVYQRLDPDVLADLRKES